MRAFNPMRPRSLSTPKTTRVSHAANSTLAPYRTEDLLQRYAPQAPRLRRFVEREVPIDLTPARRLIGFEAHYEIPLETLDLPDDL